MTVAESSTFSPSTITALREQWQTEGYVLARGLFTPAEAAKLLEVCEAARNEWSHLDVTLNRSVDNDECTNMRHVNHPAYFPHHPELLVTLLNTLADSRLLDVGRAVFGEEPEFVSATYWFNPRGKSSNGAWHRDSQFLSTTEDEEREMMRNAPRPTLQLQLALVASDDTEVVPGSHLRWDTDEEYRIRRADNGKNAKSDAMPGALRVALKPGDAVAFNPWGAHRGRYHTDKPRRTIMGTYVAQSCPPEESYFSYQPWTAAPGYLDGTTPQTRRFFERFVARHAGFKNKPTW